MDHIFTKLQAEIEARKAPRHGIPKGPVVTAGVVAFSLIAGGVMFGLHLASGALDSATLEAHRIEMQWLASARETEEVRLRLERAAMEVEEVRSISDYAAEYGIPFELARSIRREAMDAGIYPRLGFELVRVESGFHRRAVSSAGALGYAQLMPATARLLSPGITREEIFERDTNLRLGFTFLRYMIQRYDGNVRLALLAYNRGPGTVDSVLARGGDPENGYSRMVLGGRDWPFPLDGGYRLAQSTTR